MKSDNNMEFAGQGTPVSYKQRTEYCYNQSGLTAKENYGRGPTKGNKGERTAGPVEAIAAGRRVDPNKINLGAGPRNAGGTTSVKFPSNADKINAGRGPRKGNE